MVVAAMKMVNKIFKVLTSKQAYVEEDKRLTLKKMHSVELIMSKKLRKVTLPEDVQKAVEKLKTERSVKFIGEGGNIIRR
ncbi:MAG: hypothetical protein ACP5LF_06195 [Nitrososphaeria archaeon]